MGGRRIAIYLTTKGKTANFSIEDYEVRGYEFKYSVPDSKYAKGYKDNRELYCFPIKRFHFFIGRRRLLAHPQPSNKSITKIRASSILVIDLFENSINNKRFYIKNPRKRQGKQNRHNEPNPQLGQNRIHRPILLQLCKGNSPPRR